MKESVNLILKILLLSAVLSIAIKYGGPYLPIHATNSIALLIVLLPSLVMFALLSWRGQNDRRLG